MATLPNFLRRSALPAVGRVPGASRPAPHGDLRIEKDPFLLRPLPGEDLQFYRKPINNSRLVREPDPQARGACWHAIGVTAVALALAGVLLAPSVAGTLAGYKLEALRAEERRLLDEKRELELREAQLLSPDRMQKLARERNLSTPAPGQVLHLNAKGESAVAMIRK